MTPSDDIRRPTESIRRFVRSLPAIPAVLLDRHLDVVAASPLAHAVYAESTIGVHIARLGVRAADRAGPPLSGFWNSELAELLRDGVGRFEEDERFVAMVGELVATSGGFARAWAEDGPGRRSGSVDVAHDAVGTVRLEWVQLRLKDSGGASLVLACAANDVSSWRLRRPEALSGETP